MGRRAVLWVLPLLLGFAGPALALPPGIETYYAVMANERGRGMALEMRDCDGGRICGRLVALGTLPAKDVHNPAKSARSRALCGLDILSVAAEDPAQPGTLQGSFYDPRTGDENSVRLRLDHDHLLRVSGHAGQVVLSRSYMLRGEVWIPMPSVQALCEAAPVS